MVGAEVPRGARDAGLHPTYGDVGWPGRRRPDAIRHGPSGAGADRGAVGWAEPTGPRGVVEAGLLWAAWYGGFHPPYDGVPGEP